MIARHQVFQQLLVRMPRFAPLPTAVVHPCDAESLRGALDAADRGLITPILVGPAAKIRRVAAGIVLGARVPIALTSRADTAPARTASTAIAVLLGAHLKKARK